MTRYLHFALLLLLPVPLLAAEPTDVRDYGSGDMRTLHEGDTNEFTLRDITRPDEIIASPAWGTLFINLLPLLDIYSNPAGLLDDEPTDRLIARWVPLKISSPYDHFSYQTHEVAGHLRPTDGLALELGGFHFGRNISIENPSTRAAQAALAWQATDAIQTGLGGTILKTDEGSWEGQVLRGGVAFKPTTYMQLGLHGLLDKGREPGNKEDSSQLGAALLASGGAGTPRFAVRLTRIARHAEDSEYDEKEDSQSLNLMARALHTILLAGDATLDIGVRLYLQQARDEWDFGDEDKTRQHALQLGTAYRTSTIWIGGQAGHATFISEDDYGEDTQALTAFQLGAGGRFPADNGEVILCPSAGIGHIREKMESKDDYETISRESKAVRLSAGLGVE